MGALELLRRRKEYLLRDIEQQYGIDVVEGMYGEIQRLDPILDNATGWGLLEAESFLETRIAEWAFICSEWRKEVEARTKNNDDNLTFYKQVLSMSIITFSFWLDLWLDCERIIDNVKQLAIYPVKEEDR